MSTKEYKSFGPWILEVKEEEDIPRLFRTYPLDLKQSLMTIKIPRNIEWRDANPDMDLYDYLLEIQADRITALQRTDSTFAAVQIAMKDIVAVVNTVDVLKGTLTLYTNERSFAIHYNGSSEAIIQRVTNLIRRHYLPVGALAHKPEPIPLGDDTGEYVLRSYHRVLMGDQSDLTLFAAQNRRRLHLANANILQLIWAAFFPFELTGALYYCSGSELVVLSRSAGIRRVYNPSYSINYTYIPLANILSIRTADSAQYRSLVNLEIKTAAHTFVFAFDAVNAQKEAVAGLLSA